MEPLSNITEWLLSLQGILSTALMKETTKSSNTNHVILKSLNLKQGQNIEGACYLYDRDKTVVGWWDFELELLVIHSDYKFGLELSEKCESVGVEWVEKNI